MKRKNFFFRCWRKASACVKDATSFPCELVFPIFFFLGQVASAIWYLHDCDIIYRDLKADNVLVWSLDETSLLNVKLSDYGISCFATPQGVAGEEGTPGYQAPEIRTGVGYDEKVIGSE